MSTLCIWPLVSSLYSLICFSLLHSSCKLVISSKDSIKFRFSRITSGGITTFIDVRIDQWVQVWSAWFIRYEVLYLPVNLIVLVTIDNHRLYPSEVTKWWFSLLSSFLHLLTIILYRKKNLPTIWLLWNTNHTRKASSMPLCICLSIFRILNCTINLQK